MPQLHVDGSAVDPPDCGADRDHGNDDRPALPGSRRPPDAYHLGLKPFSRVVHDGSDTGETNRLRLSLPRADQYMSRTEDASMPADIMKVDDQAKIDLFQEIMPIVMQYLAANSANQELIADDIIDFFALSIASVIQNDTNLTTPQLQRKGVEAAGKHIAHWVRLLKLDHEQRGASLLAMTMGAVATDATQQ
ncbi:hypothetical protein [Sphingomonas sp. Leaf34]|uniref:hypothetical protein n=1 Tax=Sphingomonas sp. Leaf34 TaxID=1736216 RepID=UPI0012E0EE39|nr:hypothetical protein [Sphingomonas sp. Leaf34]